MRENRERKPAMTDNDSSKGIVNDNRIKTEDKLTATKTVITLNYLVSTNGRRSTRRAIIATKDSIHDQVLAASRGADSSLRTVWQNPDKTTSTRRKWRR